MDDTRTVLDRHLAALGAGDVEATLRDYSEDAVFLRPDRAYVGLAALREMFTGLYSGLLKPGTYDFSMKATQVAGEVALIVWHADCAAATITGATDTFIVRNGKIVAHTFAGTITSK